MTHVPQAQKPSDKVSSRQLRRRKEKFRRLVRPPVTGADGHSHDKAPEKEVEGRKKSAGEESSWTRTGSGGTGGRILNNDG